MITAYHRPKTLDEALTLLTHPNTLPLGGGTLLASHKPTLFDSAQGRSDPVEVVDLQSLGLDSMKTSGNNLEMGATVTLQQLLVSEDCPDVLKSALKLEAPLNIRNSATVAGTLVSCDGRSTFATALLALDAKIIVVSKQKAEEAINIGNFLPLREQIRGKLITKIIIPLNVKLAFEYVSRTPADKPIVCAAVVQWNSGRTRLTLGGYGMSPMLAMDGTESEGLETAARNAFHEATDEWASAEYRMDVAATLAKRCLERL
ncbi:MAG: FAD binding domain-containing protein [Anaerolineae bacterium]|nr:FAD binding domain-containing protein [Anaerolineae bacterium]MCI0607776.1 FAD binding domain-containing protein [Anaerolineae bacterium]